MNKRSLKRGLQKPPLREGWTRKEKPPEKVEGRTIEELLRDLFEKVLKEVLIEINRQAAEETKGLPINAWGILEGKSGQSFRLTIDCEPPSIDPNLN